MEQFWTIFITVVSGVLVYVLSQLFLEWILKPHLEFKRLLNEIKYSFTYYSDCLMNPIRLSNTDMLSKYSTSKWKEASDKTREYSSKLYAYINCKSRRKYILVAEALMLFSNSTVIGEDGNETLKELIEQKKVVNKILFKNKEVQ